MFAWLLRKVGYVKKPSFTYDKVNDCYVIKLDRNLVIEGNGSDILVFSKNIILQSSEQLHFNALANFDFSKASIDYTAYRAAVNEAIKEAEESYINKHPKTECNSVSGCEI